MNQTIFVDLRACLAKLYPDEYSIRRITADAGLDAWRIIFNSTPINNWHSILTEANKLTRIDALLDVVDREYGGNQEFQTTCVAYRRSKGQPAAVDLASAVSVPVAQVEIPYQVAVPFTEPRYFFGRERDLRRLFGLWQRPPLQNAAIIGPKRSGKSWLLHYLATITTTVPTQLRPGQRQDWLPQPEQVHWVYVDFQDPRLSTQEGLLHHLLTGLNLRIPRRCDLPSFLDIVSQGLQNPTIILLDELGVALTRYPELDDMFWEGLRSLASNYVSGNLGFVLATHESPVTVAHHSGHSSPFFNIFGYTTHLGPLTETEARTLIVASPLPFIETDVTWILEQSRRWPILLHVLCRERLVALADGETDERWKTEGSRQLAQYVALLQGSNLS
jgi:hypothetical protein